MVHRLSCAMLAAAACVWVGPALAADNAAQSGPASGGVMQSVPPQAGVITADKKRAPDLSDRQRQTVIDAIVERKSHQATPKEFKGEVGAKVSSKVNIHAMPPRIVSEVPELKDFMYAHLDQEIAIVDALDDKIVAVIPLPANLAQTSKPEGSPAAGADGKPAATTGQSPDRKIGSGTPTADPLREREESGKDSAYTGPSTTGPNTGGK